MSYLHQILAGRADQWRRDGYPTPEYTAIAEIFEWACDDETGSLRFLRAPQLRALETYWYLRLVEQTPHIFALHQRLFPTPPELLEALGLTDSRILKSLFGQPPDALWARIRTDDRFVREFRLESLRETLTLDYPSYILALAMGAGKTILIGAIFATEFAMALEYPDGPFVQNALVFAPGKTIIESLRELAAVPYDRILPPRFYKPFAASVKLAFTRDGERDIPVIRGSLYNVVVTNTEKIRIQKETIRRSDLGDLLTQAREDEARAEVANLRLQAIASLPHLAVFSDEAHHTYGQSLDADLKKVRKTVDYLAANTKVICVVNTTGTPYYQRQPLKDVVIWYGLSEGIRDNIGFHYDPYNFDSTPELEFFQQILKDLNVSPAEVEDIYFTGGLTDPAKTDFCVEYRGEDDRWHRYTPDFVIRKRPRRGGRPGSGKVLIVELRMPGSRPRHERTSAGSTAASCRSRMKAERQSPCVDCSASTRTGSSTSSSSSGTA